MLRSLLIFFLATSFFSCTLRAPGSALLSSEELYRNEDPEDDPGLEEEPPEALPEPEFEPFRWSPSVANGWFPSLSPNGKFVTFGQGEIYFADLSVGQEILVDYGNSYASRWITPGVFTYMRTLNNSQARRIEVSADSLSPSITGDNVNLVAGNTFVAADGHWASFLAGNPMRISYDNQLIQTGNGGALSIGEDGWIAFASTNNNQALKVYHKGRFVREYPVRTAMHMTAIGAGGYVVYGGYGAVHGITPAGQDSDLTVTPWRYESPAKVFYVGSEVWVATTSWNHAGNVGYVLLRPFGSRDVIAVEAAAVSLDVVVTSTAFVLAFNDDRGRLTVMNVPLNSQRRRLN